jgi:hypothetical protein
MQAAVVHAALEPWFGDPGAKLFGFQQGTSSLNLSRLAEVVTRPVHVVVQNAVYEMCDYNGNNWSLRSSK